MNEDSQDPQAPETPPQEPQAPEATTPAIDEELAALRAENQRLAGELSARYEPRYADPGTARGLEPAAPVSTAASLNELAEELGVKPEKLAKAFGEIASQVEARTLRRVGETMQAQRTAEKVAQEFFERFPKLASHRATVDQIVRGLSNDPVRLRGRNLLQEDVLYEVAQESHRALNLEFQDARSKAPAPAGTVVVAAGNVQQAQVAPGRSGGGGAAPPAEPEVDPVKEWIEGTMASQERGVSGAKSRLAGVQTR